MNAKKTIKKPVSPKTLWKRYQKAVELVNNPPLVASEWEDRENGLWIRRNLRGEKAVIISEWEDGLSYIVNYDCSLLSRGEYSSRRYTIDEVFIAADEHAKRLNWMLIGPSEKPKPKL